MNKITTILDIRQSAGSGGGTENVIINAAVSISPDRFRTMVAYLRKNKDNLSPIAKRMRENQIEYYEFPGTRFFDIRQINKLLKLIKQNNVDIIHAHDAKSDLYGYILKRICPGITFISTAHGWINNNFRGRIYNCVHKYILKKSDRVIAVSDSVREILKSSGIKKLELVHNGIDTDLWKRSNGRSARENTNAEEPFRIGFVGRISREKGPLDFVRVAKRVKEQAPNCEFFVAGEGSDRNEMEALAKESGVDNKFYFLGQLESTQLRGLYEKLDLLLLTSHTEGLPIAVLEACAMSVPVVATQVGGVSEIIIDKHNGLLASAGDIDGLAGHVLRIKQDRGLYEKFTVNGRKTVEDSFSLRERAKKLEDIFIGKK